MEETQDKSKEPYAIGDTRVAGKGGKQLPESYWHMAKNGHVQRAISKERLARAGYYSILDRYESVHLCD